jgi:hypothetical protein
MRVTGELGFDRRNLKVAGRAKKKKWVFFFAEMASAAFNLPSF